MEHLLLSEFLLAQLPDFSLDLGPQGLLVVTTLFNGTEQARRTFRGMTLCQGECRVLDQLRVVLALQRTLELSEVRESLKVKSDCSTTIAQHLLIFKTFCHRKVFSDLDPLVVLGLFIHGVS